MPKIIYNNHLKGLSLHDRQGNDGTFAEGREVDIYRDFGYIMPGWLPSILTKSDDVTQIIKGEIVDICVDSSGNKAYFIDNNYLYQMSSISAETWNANFDGSSHYYGTITDSIGVKKMIIYEISGVLTLFFSYNTAAAAYVGSLALNAANFTSADLDEITLDVSSKDSNHPMIVWNNVLWIGEGRYVAKYVGSTATFTTKALDLGLDWEISSLFTTNNYIGICAYKKGSGTTGVIGRRNDSKIFFWDGVSVTFSYSISVEDNYIVASKSFNGNSYIWSYGRNATPTMYQLTGEGLTKLRKLKTTIAGSSFLMSELQNNCIEIFQNRILMGSDFLIWSYGSDDNENQNAFTIPFGYINNDPTDQSDDRIMCISVVSQDRIYVGYSHPETGLYYILKLNTGYSTRATFRENYIDFGQKVRINYIKYYFKPLVTSDSITVGLDIDYGTAVTLKDNKDVSTCTYTADGAITSKKFMVGRDCHAFRPTVTWNAGGVAISKIVIDYDYLPNDN